MTLFRNSGSVFSSDKILLIVKSQLRYSGTYENLFRCSNWWNTWANGATLSGTTKWTRSSSASKTLSPARTELRTTTQHRVRNFQDSSSLNTDLKKELKLVFLPGVKRYLLIFSKRKTNACWKIIKGDFCEISSMTSTLYPNKAVLSTELSIFGGIIWKNQWFWVLDLRFIECLIKK